MATLSAPSLFASFLVLCSCGDPIYDQHLRGNPVHTESISVQWNGTTEADATDLQVALFFNRGVPGTTDPDDLIELTSSRTPVPDLPSRVTFNLFERPGEEHMAHAADGRSQGYGIAHLLSYRDLNRDGRFSPSADLPEKIIGRELAIQYMYLPEALPAQKLPIDRDLAAGFHHVLIPQTCGQAAPGPTTPGTCGVPIGEACAMAADCRGGYCLQQTQGSWVNGYCVVLETPMTTCRPAAAVYVRKPKQIGLPMMASGYYLKPCSTDADCLRTRDAGTLYHVCDLGLGACRLKDPQNVFVGRELGPPPAGIDLEPFCSGSGFVPKP